MRILFDKNVPVRLRQTLRNHQVRTAAVQGWGILSNGELIAQAENAGFDLLRTCDQDVEYQQNLSRHRISIVVLGSNIWPAVQSKLAEIVAAVGRAKPGSFEFIEIPPPGRRRRG